LRCIAVLTASRAHRREVVSVPRDARHAVARILELTRTLGIVGNVGLGRFCPFRQSRTLKRSNFGESGLHSHRGSTWRPRLVTARHRLFLVGDRQVWCMLPSTPAMNPTDGPRRSDPPGPRWHSPGTRNARRSSVRNAGMISRSKCVCGG
jgi:hypothetical protein